MLLRRVALTALWASVLAIDHPINITYSDMDAVLVYEPLTVRVRDNDTVDLSTIPELYPKQGWATGFYDRPPADQPPIMTGEEKDDNLWAYYGVSYHRSYKPNTTMTMRGVFTAVYVWGMYTFQYPFNFTVDGKDYPIVRAGPQMKNLLPDAVVSDQYPNALGMLMVSATGLDMSEHEVVLTVQDPGEIQIMNVTITTLVSSDAKDVSKTDTAVQYPIKHPIPQSNVIDDLEFSNDWTFEAPSGVTWSKEICTQAGCRNDTYPVAGVKYTKGATAAVQTPLNASLVQLWGSNNPRGVSSYEVRFDPPPPYGGLCSGSQRCQWATKWIRMCTMPLDPTKRYNMTVIATTDDGSLNIHSATYYLATCNNCSKEELVATDAAESVTSAAGPSVSTRVAVAAAGTRGSTNKGAIAGGVVGGVVGLALLALLFLCWRRRQGQKEDVVAASFLKDNYSEEGDEEPAPPHIVPFQRVASGEQAVGQSASGMEPFSPKATYTPRSARDSSTSPSGVLSPGSSSGTSQPHQSSCDWQEMDAGPIPTGPARLIPPSYNPAWRPDESSDTV